jgi:hypothetical protein
MAIVVALDVHRRQITYEAFDRETGELWRGVGPVSVWRVWRVGWIDG